MILHIESTAMCMKWHLNNYDDVPAINQNEKVWKVPHRVEVGDSKFKLSNILIKDDESNYI